MQQLIDDIHEEIDGIFNAALDVLVALLRPYKDWSEDRVLGPPFDLGREERPDALPAFRDRLIVLGGPARFVQRIIDGQAGLDLIFKSYDRGLHAGLSVAAWRVLVNRAFRSVADAIEAAYDELPKGRRPDPTALNDKNYLFKEHVADFLGIKPETAQKNIGAGVYGPPVRAGTRNAVRTSDFIAWLHRDDGGDAAEDIDVDTVIDQVIRKLND